MKDIVFICRIWQANNHVLSITWNDGVSQDFRLSDLQKNCPCANCTDEISGRRLIDAASIDVDLRAIAIRSVGRYALRIQFLSGCSKGIYSFDMLRNLSLLRS